jgi:hypothetical protein
MHLHVYTRDAWYCLQVIFARRVAARGFLLPLMLAEEVSACGNKALQMVAGLPPSCPPPSTNYALFCIRFEGSLKDLGRELFV